MPAALNPVDISNQVVFLELEHSDVNWTCFTLKLHVLTIWPWGAKCLVISCGGMASAEAPFVRQLVTTRTQEINKVFINRNPPSKSREEPYGAQLDLATV